MNRPYTQWFMLLFALLVLLGIIAYNGTQMKFPGPPSGQPQNTRQSERPMSPSSGVLLEKTPLQNEFSQGDSGQVPKVTVVRVNPASYRAQISAFGAAHAQYELTLKSQVTGQVISISPEFDSGLRLAQNDELLRVDDSDYLAALASAKAEVANTQLSLLEAEREVVQAKAEWEAAGLEGNPDSELVLHKPQLVVAKADLTRAEASLASARRDQNNTRIVAPFDAVVAERLVVPGSYVQTGTEVATLYSSERMEIALALSSRDWQNLPDAQTLSRGEWPVQLTSVEAGKRWQGRVVRLEQHLDKATRQRTLIVAVEQPLDQSPPLLPGTFLKASINGRMVDDLWRLPHSAYSQRGEIWYLNEDDTLASYVTQPLFSDADSIYVPVPSALAASSQQVLARPLNNYLQGMGASPSEQAIKGETSND